MNQRQFTIPFEGAIPHLYLDTRANVTCGIGFLVPNKDALDKFEWQPDVLTARDDYDRVKTEKPAQVASAYEPLCQARLTQATMDAHFDAHTTAVGRQLEPTWHLSSLPIPAQVALIDMAFNLGVGGLNKYKKLLAAVEAKNWLLASRECSRKGIQKARNDATRDLFMSLEESWL